MNQNEQWYALVLGNTATTLAEQTSQMAKATHYWISIDCPDVWAVFIHGAAGEPNLQRHQQLVTTLYFPPSAAAYAKTVAGAVPCRKPPRTGLRVLAGHPDVAWDVHFP